MLSILLSSLQHLRTAYANWRRRQAAYEELNSLDDRSLADIGISRSDIPHIFSRDIQDAAKAQASGLVRPSVRRAA
jgi:uncharacterized protein YjiS (DUF1127 family)